MALPNTIKTLGFRYFAGAAVLLALGFLIVRGPLTKTSEPEPQAAKTAEQSDHDLDYFRTVRVKDAIKASLRDPASAKFRDVRVSRTIGSPVVCGWVNSKNGLGGYTGDKPFLASDDAIQMPASVTKDFQRRWARACDATVDSIAH